MTTAIDPAAGLIARILAASAPAQMLEQTIAELEAAQDYALSAAVYEAVCYRVPVHDYWLHFRMCKAYGALGPAGESAAFAQAAAVVQLQPDGPGSDQAYRTLFLSFLRRGMDRAALDLFRHQMRHVPQHPSALPHELAPILQRLGEAGALEGPQHPPAPIAHTLHPVVAEDIRPPSTFPTFGGATHYALLPILQPMTRPAIAVGEFANAEVLIYRNIVVVVDSAGNIAEPFCVGDYPQAVRSRIAASERAGELTAAQDVEEAVVIADRFPAPNICHFLCDQITRLALYRRLRVDTARVLVIGPEEAMPAQTSILRRAGVAAHLGTDRIARLRVRRLWVSSTCRGVCHVAHHGAGWAMEYIHDITGGRGSKGWRRLYLSRNDAQLRRVVNEDAVMALLEPLGFERIVPGQMSHDSQMAAFKQASHIVAPHGAALGHLPLCPPDAQVLEIFHPLYGTYAYAMLAAAVGLRYAAMIARDALSDAPEWNDPAAVDIGARRFLDRNMRVDLGTLSEYLASID
jgi:capsular polysaccharide biosynthesis protein